MLIKSVLVVAFVAAVSAQQKNFVGVDNLGDLVLNSTTKVVKANGKQVCTIDQINDLQKQISDLKNIVITHITPSVSPTSSPTTSTPSVSPTVSPSRVPTDQSSMEIIVNGKSYTGAGSTITINGAMKVNNVTMRGNGKIMITARGAQGGAGAWNSPQGPGAPGGVITVTHTISYQTYTTLYAFVAPMPITPIDRKNLAGAGGGSTDIRTVYTGSMTSVTDSTFFSAFMNSNSLNSRWVTAGGGGGAHGSDTYGYWRYQNRFPGAGGPIRKNCTDAGTSNDGNIVNTGASTTQGGQDGGNSVSSTYTKSGTYGSGGIVSSVVGKYTTLSSYSGMGWPNGGSGTSWANGGGGGGWYGGATNWPNGGGGSSHNTVGTVTSNLCAANYGNGQMTIKII